MPCTATDNVYGTSHCCLATCMFLEAQQAGKPKGLVLIFLTLTPCVRCECWTSGTTRSCGRVDSAALIQTRLHAKQLCKGCCNGKKENRKDRSSLEQVSCFDVEASANMVPQTGKFALVSSYDSGKMTPDSLPFIQSAAAAARLAKAGYLRNKL